MLIPQWGRRGLRSHFASIGWIFCLVTLLASGCSRKSARVHTIPTPQQLEEKLTRAIEQSEPLADGKKAEAPRPPKDAKDKKEADTNQRLKLALDADMIGRGGKLSGTVSGGFGDDVVRVLWVDGANRVVSVAEVRPTKERENAASFELPLPPETVGTQHRAVLVAATREAAKKAAKNGDDPFRVQAQAKFSVASAKADFSDYRVILGGDSALAGAEQRRELSVSAGWLPYGAIPQSGTDYVGTALLEEVHPLLQTDPFSDAAIQDVALFLEKSTANLSAPLGWSLFDCSPAGAGHFAAVELDSARGEVFQAWLRERYGKLATLNAHWGTAFRAWNEVAAAPTDTIKAAHNEAYAAKLDGEEAEEKDAEEKKAADAQPDAQDDFELTPEELRAPGGENFGPWCDARSFDDFTFARLLREYRSRLRAMQPGAFCGLTGAQAPAAWGGWDWFQLARSLDWIEAEFAPSYTRTLARSFNPRLSTISRISAGRQPDVYALWDRWLRGDSGCVLAGQNSWVDAAGAPTTDTRALAGEVKELSAGLTLLRNQGLLREDGVAIWYSPRSIQLHWLLDSEADGSHWINRNRDTDLRQSSAHLQFQAWTMLLEDLGYAPRFIHPQQAFEGGLDASNIRVLILPKVLSLSDGEARVIRNFANSGGLVIADGACGTFDGIGRRRMLLRDEHPAGALDAEFGIGRADLVLQERNGTFTGDPETSRVLLRDRVSGQPLGPESNELRILEPGLTLMGAQSHARAKGVEGKRGAPALATRAAGLGRYVYLNLSLQDYPVLRALPSDESFRYHGLTRQEYSERYGAPRGGEALRLVISDMLAETLGENALKLRDDNGLPLRGVRRTCFDLGNGVELHGLLPQGAISIKPGEAGIEVSGLAFTEPRSVWTGTGASRHWYDLRSGTYLGHEKMVRATLDPYRATLLSALPYKIEKLSVKCRRLDERGVFKLNVQLGGDGGAMITHVLHFDVHAPNGELLPHLSRNVLAPRGQWSGAILLGLNQPSGNYKVVVRDVISGRSTEADLIKDVAEYLRCVPVVPAK